MSLPPPWFFFWKRENLGRSDDAKRRKKRGWPKHVKMCRLLRIFPRLAAVVQFSRAWDGCHSSFRDGSLFFWGGSGQFRKQHSMHSKNYWKKFLQRQLREKWAGASFYPGPVFDVQKILQQPKGEKKIYCPRKLPNTPLPPTKIFC